MMLRESAGRARPVLLASLGLLLVGAWALATVAIGDRNRRDDRPGIGALGATGAEPREADDPASLAGSAPLEPGRYATPSESEGVGGDPVQDARSVQAEEPSVPADATPPPAEAEDSVSEPAAEATEGRAAMAEGRPQADADPEPPPHADPEPPPDVAELLARAEETYGELASLWARFRQTIEVPLMNRRREGYGIWYQQGQNRFRMDFVDPPEDEIVADGQHLWLYYPSTNPGQVIKSALGSGTQAGTADVLAQILEEARSAYEGTYGARERVGDVETHLVVLRPLEAGSLYRRVRVWIGIDDYLVRRFEITEANETVRTVTLEDLRPDAPIPEGTFRFTPPPDADVFER